MKIKLSFLMFLFVAVNALALDSIVTDSDKYKVLFENEKVRVLEYSDQPGEKTHQHHHPAFVLYALSAFERKITLPDGKIIMRNFKAGDVIYSEEQTHIGENVGQTPTHVIIVEMKLGEHGAVAQ
ncbi:MAG: hypothetical protein OEL80_04480 [Desulfuromonadales bacterium]|jgi:hypothetical protein|nr:hypothetical protein [Desulfuromonadales bacterium]